ncbi:MAG TPA: AMP-binding protein [Candidatus Eisenbacteria bacterium]|nr:AMP-binding protein [Candidatus Eisenbacteria bacterium]
MTQASTPDPIQFWARVAPDRLALRHGGRTFTYGQLNAAVQESADAFLVQGLGAGEHLSLEFEPHHPLPFAIAFHSCQRADVLPAPIGTSLTLPERQVLRERAMVELVLTSETIGAAQGKTPAAAQQTAAPTVSVRDRRLDAPAALCFTSGTGGASRACILTHGNFFWSALQSARNLGVRPNDLWLDCLPLHHVGGLSILTRSAYYGTGVLLHDRFDADAVNQAIDAEGVTLLSLVPPMLERLLEGRRGRIFPTSLRAALIGGGPIPAALLEQAADLRLHALPTYGLTEAASQVTTLSLREWPAGLESAGRPLMLTQVEIRDSEGHAAGRGIEGEIVVRGPTVMAAYLEDEQSNAAVRDGRWLKTGDVGAWDPAWRLLVKDRRIDRIAVGGENVSPEEVERVLREHPGVADACVVGVPAGSWGHEVAAAIQTRGDAVVTIEDLRRHAEPALASFKLPRRLLVLPELPRSPSGKLLRRVVRDRFRNQVPEEELT